VQASTTPRTNRVGRVGQVRNPYSSVALIQIRCSGMVSQSGNTMIAIRPSTNEIAQAASSQPGG